MNLSLAINDPRLTKILSTKYGEVYDFTSEKEVNELGSLLPRPDTLILLDSFCKMTIQKVVNLKHAYPFLRIIYIMADPEYTKGTIKKVEKLINSDIYDFYIGNDIDIEKLCNLIENPKSYDEVATWLSEIISDQDTEVYKKVTTVSSLKPGSGKTFLATNLAIAIANYGQDKRKEGKLIRPRVLLLDGDLLNLSISTMTKVDNYDRNMLTALKKISQNVREDGSYKLSKEELKNMEKFVRSCLSRYKGKDNLYIMAAADIPLEDLSEIAPAHFYFMVQMLQGAFDVIIVDSNSAFDHTTTAALFELSGNILLLLDNDFNNIQNNLRYVERLSELGYEDKLHFIVNKDLTHVMEQDCLEDLAYDTKRIGSLLIEHRIPLGDAGKIKSIDYGEKFLVETDDLEDLRSVILDIANEIWKIDESRIPRKEESKKVNKIVQVLNK